MSKNNFLQKALGRIDLFLKFCPLNPALYLKIAYKLNAKPSRQEHTDKNMHRWTRVNPSNRNWNQEVYTI